jgi:hypothetical protein
MLSRIAGPSLRFMSAIISLRGTSVRYHSAAAMPKGVVHGEGEFEPKDHSELSAALGADTLQGYLQDAGLRIERRYGDYALSPYRPRTSDRLVLVARKPER